MVRFDQPVLVKSDQLSLGEITNLEPPPCSMIVSDGVKPTSGRGAGMKREDQGEGDGTYRGSLRRVLMALALLCVSTALASLLPALATGRATNYEDESVGPDGENPPYFQREIDHEFAEEKAAEAKRGTPAEVAARAESATAYEDLSSEAAQRLARRAFPDLLKGRTWIPPEPQGGREDRRLPGPRRGARRTKGLRPRSGRAPATLTGR